MQNNWQDWANTRRKIVTVALAGLQAKLLRDRCGAGGWEQLD